VIATIKDYFEDLEANLKSGYPINFNLKSLDYDFTLYDEQTHFLGKGNIQSVNRWDYWSGFFLSMAGHKALIKQAFQTAQNT
jgi:hypothetical protein